MKIAVPRVPIGSGSRRPSHDQNTSAQGRFRTFAAQWATTVRAAVGTAKTNTPARTQTQTGCDGVDNACPPPITPSPAPIVAPAARRRRSASRADFGRARLSDVRFGATVRATTAAHRPNPTNNPSGIPTFALTPFPSARPADDFRFPVRASRASPQPRLHALLLSAGTAIRPTPPGPTAGPSRRRTPSLNSTGTT